MKYLRAIISSKERGKVYKKDFTVEAVCGRFVRMLVDRLIATGIMWEGQLYRAQIIPRQGQEVMPPSVTAQRLLQKKEKSPWLTLEFDLPVSPDEPISHFILDIYVVTQQLSYRTTFEVSIVDYFWRGIDKALQQLGALRYQESLDRKLYARDDDQHDFEHEEVQLAEPDQNPLIEIIGVEEKKPPIITFPQKFLSDYTIQATKKLEHGKLVDVVDASETAQEEVRRGVQIFITDTALAGLQHLARTDAHVERGGMLVGNVYENAESNDHGYIVEIMAHIAAEEAYANEVELRYTFRSWQKQNSLLKQHFPEKRIVGWYHTHLDVVKQTYYTDTTLKDTYSSPLFFSRDDVFTHTQFFREKWYVGMVLDPRGDLAFYQWVGDEVKQSSRFYVVEATKETKEM